MAYYRIKEAAEKIGVLPHVLQFWESQFPAMKPPKTSRGQRLYSDEDIENFQKIKFLLYSEGYSIPGAKRYLKEQKDSPRVENSVDEVLEKQLCRELLKDLNLLRDSIRDL